MALGLLASWRNHKHRSDAPFPAHGLGEHSRTLLQDRLDFYSTRAAHEQREGATVRSREGGHCQCEVALYIPVRRVKSKQSRGGGVPIKNNVRGSSAENLAKPYV